MAGLPEAINIRIFETTEGSVVDAEVLARILQAMQRAVHILAMDEIGIDPASPGYVPQNIQRTFPVRCLVPERGSFSLPLQIGNLDDLTIPETAQNIMGRLMACMKGLVSDDPTPYTDQVRNGRFRVRLLDTFRTMLPKPGATWKLGISRPEAKEIILSSECVQHVSSLKERLHHREIVTQTITGNLQAMDFEAHKITILHPESNRELECFYNEEIEPELWETRRGLVQVTGIVVVDEQGTPSKIQDVKNIQPLDLSDFDIRDVPYEGFVLLFHAPLRLTPELTDSKQYMILRHEPLDIDVIAPTREELLTELYEQIGVLWREYAKEDDANLTPSARELKQRLLNALCEKPGNE